MHRHPLAGQVPLEGVLAEVVLGLGSVLELGIPHEAPHGLHIELLGLAQIAEKGAEGEVVHELGGRRRRAPVNKRELQADHDKNKSNPTPRTREFVAIEIIMCASSNNIYCAYGWRIKQ
eukprot:scaffold672342_cov42-Prasinocladus_malaysianus.AAC.1